jgi:hypothetical protein
MNVKFKTVCKVTVTYKQRLQLLQISTYNDVYHYSYCVPLFPENIYLQLSLILKRIMCLQSDTWRVLCRCVRHGTGNTSRSQIWELCSTVVILSYSLIFLVRFTSYGSSINSCMTLMFLFLFLFVIHADNGWRINEIVLRTSRALLCK